MMASPQTAAVQFGSNPVTMTLFLGILALLPFFFMMVTSFLKFSVVLSILRQAMGTQQIPPNTVIMGFALILTMYVMTPVGIQIYDAVAQDLEQSTRISFFSERGAATLLNTFQKAESPLKDFLRKHTHKDNLKLFSRWYRVMNPDAGPDAESSLLVLIPAFAVSELTEAFLIGFILFMPFLVIDMVVSNILLAMGMHMLSPTVVSLPFKLLLFVAVDGWKLISQGLLQPYILS